MGDDYFYEGADYGTDPEYGTFSQAYVGEMYKNISLATDARVANQLKAATEKLNTGATSVEISTISPDIFETIPKEHFKELNRLRKLVGGNVELTLHAPLVEPTGLTKKGWDEHDREQAERQMVDAVIKAHELNPEGNVVTTFHASIAGLPAETEIWEGEGKEKKRIVKEVVVIDENTGNFAQIPVRPSQFLSEDKKEVSIKDKISEINEKNWYDQLHHLDYAAELGESTIEKGIKLIESKENKKINEKDIINSYKDYVTGKTEAFEKFLEKEKPEVMDFYRDQMKTISYGDINLRQAYNNLKEIFDQSYRTFELSNSERAKENIEKLDKFRAKIEPRINELNKPENLIELAKTVRDGVHVLRSIETSQIPQVLKPLKEFAINKSAETFSNVALDSYKKFGEHSPIISLENHPAGQAIITSGRDIRRLIEETRDRFAAKAVKECGLSKDQAREEAEKLIGATWDVGHINQIRKFGAGDEELKIEAKAIAPVLKHIHLSDNFGIENIELPMGMGNVPKETFRWLKEESKNFDKIKKVVEVGNWYQHFQSTPLQETLRAFGSPIYAPGAGSYWSSRGYFSGYGMNPEIHHSLYGAGFANLPTELGGQIAGRSRLSGSPME